MSVCLFVRLSVCVFTFEVPFKCLFAPTSWSGMSNIFRDLEFFGKSNGRKWSQILKIAKQKKTVFFGWFFCFRRFFLFYKKLGFRVFLVYPTVVSVILSASVVRCFVSRMQDFFFCPAEHSQHYQWRYNAMLKNAKSVLKKTFVWQLL